MSTSLAIGKVIKMPCMRRGLCAYSKETILVSQETLIKLSPSAMGIPVVIDHPSELITDENIKDINTVGRVADLHYESYEDSWYAHFVIDKQEGIDLLQNGWGVSTAWFGDKYADGGTHNNVGYDRELLEGRYEHLAIVKTPRYEMAVNPIFLNSNTCKDNNTDSTIDNTYVKKIIETERAPNMIGKLFKRLVTREELKTNEGEELFVNIDGKDIALNDVIKEVTELKMNTKKEEEKKEEEKKMANEADEVDVDGEKMTVAQLKKAYKNKCKSNETESEKKKEEKVSKDVEILKEKQSKDDYPKGKKENEIIENEKKEEVISEDTMKNFNMIKEVHVNGITYKVEDSFLSTRERVNIGKDKYGKK
jgi:hypothetical protein